MKLAIVNDDLIQHGGQENILEELLNIYPDADLYCSVISKEWKEYLTNRGIKYHTSFLDKWPFITKISRYVAPFLLHTLAYESFDFTGYDVVLSSSSRFSHHIVTKPSTVHLCYMHSPGRMLWNSYDYFKDETFGIFYALKKIGHIFLSYALGFMRMGDYISAQRVDFFAANSSVSKRRIKKFYGRDADLIFPFVADISTEDSFETGDYFVVISRLVAWKRVELVIDACIRGNYKLKIIGTGSDEKRLRKIANGNPLIEFLGRVSNAEKYRVILESKALIQPQLEDFGIVPLEANALGKPVICFGKGGVLDTQIEGETALFFNSQDVETLLAALNTFNSSNYDSKVCIKNSERFSKQVFRQQIINFVEKNFK